MVLHCWPHWCFIAEHNSDVKMLKHTKSTVFSLLLCYFSTYCVVWTPNWKTKNKNKIQMFIHDVIFVGVHDSFGCFHKKKKKFFFSFLFVYSAPIRDKTRKPKLLKPQPRKLVLVSRSSFIFSAISSEVIILCLQTLVFIFYCSLIETR